MKNILFFTQSRWAFANIHYSLIKELYAYGINANLLDWTQPYTQTEFDLINESYDLIITNPEAIDNLMTRGIAPEKLGAVAHGQWDILLARQQGNGTNFLSKIKKFGVVSDNLVDKCKEFSVERVPVSLPIGIQFDNFYRKPAPQLRNIGYAGAYDSKNFNGENIKRGHLVKNVVNNINGCNLVEHEFFNWMCMPSYYNRIHAVVMTSTEESVGLPMMEAAAAGRLVIGTGVGYFEYHNQHGGGILLPTEEQALQSTLHNTILTYGNDDKLYVKKCLEIQEYARENYDWKFHIHKWVEFLS